MTYTPLKNDGVSSSVGMMKFPIYGNIKAMFQTHQPDGDWNVRKLGNLPWFKQKNTNENDGLNNKHGILPATMQS